MPDASRPEVFFEDADMSLLDQKVQLMDTIRMFSGLDVDDTALNKIRIYTSVKRSPIVKRNLQSLLVRGMTDDTEDYVECTDMQAKLGRNRQHLERTFQPPPASDTDENRKKRICGYLCTNVGTDTEQLSSDISPVLSATVIQLQLKEVDGGRMSTVDTNPHTRWSSILTGDYEFYTDASGIVPFVVDGTPYSKPPPTDKVLWRKPKEGTPAAEPTSTKAAGGRFRVNTTRRSYRRSNHSSASPEEQLIIAISLGCVVLIAGTWKLMEKMGKCSIDERLTKRTQKICKLVGTFNPLFFLYPVFWFARKRAAEQKALKKDGGGLFFKERPAAQTRMIHAYSQQQAEVFLILSYDTHRFNMTTVSADFLVEVPHSLLFLPANSMKQEAEYYLKQTALLSGAAFNRMPAHHLAQSSTAGELARRMSGSGDPMARLCNYWRRRWSHKRKIKPAGGSRRVPKNA